MSVNNFENLKKLVEIVSTLRSPKGCPWDREQNHKTLKENLLQETYEVFDAIDSGDIDELKDELGDVLLQVVFHAQIAAEEKNFDIEDVAKCINEKLIRRHPHVFGDIKVKDSNEVIENWDKIKRQEKPERKSALCGIAKTLPALAMADELSKKAVKTGFEWPDFESLKDCLKSEIAEFKKAVEEKNIESMEDEFGDILFTMVNVARWNKIDPEQALLKANKKFKQRFQVMENIADKEFEKYSADEFEELWQNAKKHIQKQ